MSPVKNRIGGVFVHVTDMGRSIRWYRDLLGLPADEQPDLFSIYGLPTQGGSALLLDSNHPDTQRQCSVLFVLATDDIEASHTFVQARGIEVLGGIERGGDQSFFSFRDPDGNLLMVGQDECR
jgi:predicted enzyme related to lactoylglutathione lyase